MHRELDKLLNDLLARWHLWQGASTRVDDTLLRDFDALVARVPPKLRGALALQARNLACGAFVWSSPRQLGNLGEARAFLQNLLGDDESRWFGPAVVRLNERGNRIGESNPQAKLTDHEVDLLLELRAETTATGAPKYSYSWLAEKFECSKSAVQWWCNGGRRGQVPARVKQVAR